MKKILCFSTLILLMSCSAPNEISDITGKVTESLPGIVDGAKDIVKPLPDMAEKLKAYVYDSKGYDLIRNFEKDIKNQTVVHINSDNGQAEVDLSGIESAIQTANSLKSRFTNEFLTTNDSEQVKEIERTVTIDAKNLNAVKLAKDLAQADVDNIVIKYGIVEIGFSPEMLAKEFQEHESINVTVNAAGNSYDIKFHNENGDEIKLQDNVTITINEKGLKNNSVVYALAQGAQSLIGGKIEDGAIVFQTKTGGEFATDINNVKFNDIGSLDKRTKTAIESLAAKGIVGAESDNFHPEKTVSRAEAVTMLTKTLYKYDKDMTAGFSDVKENDWFYTAVASGAAEKIVNGYPDNTFRPLNIISKQELLTIAANSLISNRRFLLPDDTAMYLDIYEGEISGWAKPYVAMTIRDGVIEQDFATNGEGEITRAEAALVLYNLLERL